jgi:aminoglycoside phosphotransferase (APT) family kinase protein
MEELWRCGFRPDGERAMAVPEPLGVVPELHMVLQRAVPGRVATELVGGPSGVALMGRVAEAIHALHGAGIPTHRRHTLADELRILGERLSTVIAARPEWEQRIERLLRACEGLASRVKEPPPRGIHRDFYPDQVIVDGGRLTLLDLDLYALGDPALDVGNFAGHLTELALRCWGDPEALRDREEALEERYLELAGDVSLDALRAYAVLTLARHVHISTTFPARRHTTSALLELCEERLALGRSAWPRQKFMRSRREAR